MGNSTEHSTSIDCLTAVVNTSPKVHKAIHYQGASREAELPHVWHRLHQVGADPHKSVVRQSGAEKRWERVDQVWEGEGLVAAEAAKSEPPF